MFTFLWGSFSTPDRQGALEELQRRVHTVIVVIHSSVVFAIGASFVYSKGNVSGAVKHNELIMLFCVTALCFLPKEERILLFRLVLCLLLWLYGMALLLTLFRLLVFTAEQRGRGRINAERIVQ
jgi:hypothetical protein